MVAEDGPRAFRKDVLVVINFLMFIFLSLTNTAYLGPVTGPIRNYLLNNIIPFNVEQQSWSRLKILVLYATDRFKAVAILCGFVCFTTRRFMLSLTLLLVLVFLFSIVITPLGEERLVYSLIVHFCLPCMRYFLSFFFFSISLSLGVMVWLRLFIEALPVLYFLNFLIESIHERYWKMRHP